MTFSRRDTLVLGLGGMALTALPARSRAAAIDDLTAAFTGGVTPAPGGITLTAPELAENGNAVAVSIEAPGALAILLLAPDNPQPAVATFTFGPAAGNAYIATRIRLARTQEVVALARMGDGSVRRAAARVEVTVGGCGA